MKILIATNHLDQLGGSETFTYTMVKAALEYGAEVEFFTFRCGIVSRKISDDFGIKFLDSTSYDLVIANHNTIVNHLHAFGVGPIIQTCHGLFPALEQPCQFANALVAISEEVENRLNIINPGVRVVKLIRNMIDTERFSIRQPVSVMPKNVYSLSQSDKFNVELKNVLNDRGIWLVMNNKFNNPVWHTERYINDADFVVSLGRGAMEAMSCGRQVMVADHRPYQEKISDGMISAYNIDDLAPNNFSGRKYRYDKAVEEMVDEALDLYDYRDSEKLRVWVVENLDYHTQFEKYMTLYHSL